MKITKNYNTIHYKPFSDYHDPELENQHFFKKKT